jgi:apolipoprotein N-acyltransferase
LTAVTRGVRLLAALRGLTGRKRLAAAFILGVVSALALPPVHALPLLLVAFPGLLALLDGATPRRAFWTGCCFAIGHHLVGLYWITEAILFDAAHFWWLVPFAVPFLSAVLAPFIAIPCILAARTPKGWPRVLVLAGSWTLFSLAQQFTATGFPWNVFGSVWGIPGPVGDVMIQPAAFVGVHGLTLATILLACVPALGRRAMIGGAAMLFAWAGLGAYRLESHATAPVGLTVVLVQGNVAQGQKADRSFSIDMFRRHLMLTEQGVSEANGKPTLVIWPETASPFLVESDAAARAAIAEAAAGPAMIGSLRFDEHRRVRNSLVAVFGPGPAVATYDKWHLVPFGEYIPDWTPVPLKILPGEGLAKGAGPSTIRMPGVPPAGALICYEAIFPGFVVDEADRPDWMVNITNDAWFGNSSGPRQHLAAVRMRAVEEGLPVMRAANTGISAAFDAHGRELGRLGMGEQGVLLVDLPGKLPPTLFGRLGLYAPLALALGVSLTGWAGSRRRTESELVNV